MHLIAAGLVRLGEYKGYGQLLFTETSLYVLYPNEEANKSMKAGGYILGLLGVLIGVFIDRRRAKKAPPNFLDDSELSCLTEKEKKSLLTTELLAKVSLDGSLTVKRAGTGFDFFHDDGVTVVYRGILHCKKIAKFLEEHGVTVDTKLKVKCPGCGRSLKGATEAMIGDTAVCPKCKAEFTIEKKSSEVRGNAEK